MSDTHTIQKLVPAPITAADFAPYGQVITPTEDGVPFSKEDAQLDLSRGTPRFYNMRLPNRGLAFDTITRHQRVTQCLAAVGGADWFIAVSPPTRPDESPPTPETIKAFHIPGDTAIKLHTGTWHVGPFFAAPEVSFFNLELADTNIVDHENHNLVAAHGAALEIAVA